MDLIEQLKIEHGVIPKPLISKKKVQQQARVQYVPYPVYSKKSPSSWSTLRELKGNKALKQFKREERAEQIESFKHGVSNITSGAKKIGRYIKSNASEVKRYGISGLLPLYRGK